MQKIKAKIITALLLAALSLTLVPFAFASSGNILINDNTAPQDLPITSVPAGGNVSLYFGDITFSGSQFYLLLSANGLSEVSSGDIRYTPLFNVASVTSTSTILQVPGDATYPGAWTVGQNWINGTTPLNVPGGTFYVKAFDGAVAALAVTQGFPVTASLRIIPNAGSAGTSIIVSGNAFPANSLVNLTYLDPLTGPPYHTINNLTATNALGQFNYTMNAPDLKGTTTAGDTGLPVPSDLIQFQATLNASTPVVYTAVYNETRRGLVQFGEPNPPGPAVGSVQNATGIYGNLTSFTSTVSVGVFDTLRIAGNSFYPGAVAIRWDNSIDLGSATASNTGFFNTTVTVPATGVGVHNVTLIDNGLVAFVVFLSVEPSITVSPTSGPIGTVVTVTGYGFPASTGGNVYNATVTFSGFGPDRNGSLTDANGQFTTTFAIPANSAGGLHTITATANATEISVTASFTVTAAFTLSPTEFYSNSSGAVVATGTGFNPANSYFVAIDNQFSPFSNTTNGITPSAGGTISFTFIQAGFQPGVHVVALYQTGSGSSTGGLNAPAANATFTVLGGNVTLTSDVLTAINNTVTQINSTVTLNSQTLAAINASVVAITGNVATLSTAIGNLTVTVNAIGANVTSIKGTVATIQTTVGTIQTLVTAINANITGINSGFATVQTSVGTLTTTLSSIGSTLTGVSGTVGTISTTVGDISTDLTAIGTKVTSIQGTVATIQTDLGTLTGTVTSIQGNVATIQTNIGTLQASVDDVQTSVDSVPGQVNIPIWIAVVLALIAAIAAIASLLLVRRKIAG